MMASRRLEISVEMRKLGPHEVALVRPLGDIDLSNSEELAVGLRSSRSSPAKGVVLDLREVPFMDSSGLTVVMRAVRELGPGFALVVAEGSAVATLFELTGVTDRLAFFATEQEALASVETVRPDAG